MCCGRGIHSQADGRVQGALGRAGPWLSTLWKTTARTTGHSSGTGEFLFSLGVTLNRRFLLDVVGRALLTP